MKKCNHVTTEVAHDHDLKAFQVHTSRGRLLGTIVPNSLKAMTEIRQDIADGDCPVCGRWEDGLGNTCNSQGWGANH